MHGTVAEDWTSGCRKVTHSAHRAYACVQGDSSQADNHLHPRQQSQLRVQPRRAVAQFLWRRFVPRRSASRRRRNPHIVQLQTVVAARCNGLRGKARLIKNRIQKLAGAIAGKRPPRPIRAMRARRKPDHNHSRQRISERRNRLSPVLPLPPLPPLHPRNLSAVRAQPRAALAADDALVQYIQRTRTHRPLRLVNSFPLLRIHSISVAVLFPTKSKVE